MLAFRVPRDSPRELSCSTMILDDLNYGIGSFEGFVIEGTDYITWFLQSLTMSIIDDCPVSGGRVLRGIVSAHRTLEAHLRIHIDTL